MHPLLAADSVWDTIPAATNADGPVAAGGDLDLPTLAGAYRRGIVPWPPGDPDEAADLQRRFGAAVASGAIPGLPSPSPGDLRLPWWSPDPRAVIAVDGVHLGRSLRSTLRRAGWVTTLDRAFAAVVAGCRERRNSEWITPDLAAGYEQLHQAGLAHSLEVWDGTSLTGGIFGVLVGAVFIGESMFHRRPDAAKAAVAELARRLQDAGATLLDTQFMAPHLRHLGAVEMSRHRFTTILEDGLDRTIELDARPYPIARLAPNPGGPPQPEPVNRAVN